MTAKRRINFYRLIGLAQGAVPVTESDYGSDLHIELQNKFCDYLESVLTPDRWERFEDYALKATDEEMAMYGLRLAGEQWFIKEDCK